jgi:hypothetical protein
MYYALNIILRMILVLEIVFCMQSLPKRQGGHMLATRLAKIEVNRSDQSTDRPDWSCLLQSESKLTPNGYDFPSVAEPT